MNDSSYVKSLVAEAIRRSPSRRADEVLDALPPHELTDEELSYQAARKLYPVEFAEVIAGDQVPS